MTKRQTGGLVRERHIVQPQISGNVSRSTGRQWDFGCALPCQRFHGEALPALTQLKSRKAYAAIALEAATIAQCQAEFAAPTCRGAEHCQIALSCINTIVIELTFGIDHFRQPGVAKTNRQRALPREPLGPHRQITLV